MGKVMHGLTDTLLINERTDGKFVSERNTSNIFKNVFVKYGVCKFKRVDELGYVSSGAITLFQYPLTQITIHKVKLLKNSY